ncbi:tRNA (adenine(58)-N(1))-methyltransferase non-catalytic subunit TRM6 [Copidosoma floridanum]|uniref:tRNA (adenine(58)-N(1))-methyltransferase non-catalytic subunit TRM6 n=1 Tax=Copidosoma floridanum TaxID=29053 RepID=UPI0006C96DFE|nr:tRNA (adenine(58)-N(1))-methyltransferase non-catalytic subunit TRM6 [Copidosoma floridanum]
MKETEVSELVKVGSHVVVQKLNFKKVYRVSETGSLTLGKEDIQMSEIIGKPFWTAYKVVSSKGDPREKKSKRSSSTLVVAKKCESLGDLKDSVSSGHDNRCINDDGKSQKLSRDDILNFRDAGKSGREIVSSLIVNNASFTEKTEFSQEKYIKKKEKKYCQFLSIHKPTLAALQEIYLRQDSAKIYGMRMDAIAQILSYSDVKCNGTFILYDSGTAGLVPAAMLSRIGANTAGNLLYLHSGDHLPQMPIARAMNFSDEQFGRLVTVSIFDFLRKFYGKQPNTADNHSKADVLCQKTIIKDEKSDDSFRDNNENHECNATMTSNDLKRKITEDTDEGPVLKKSRKVLEIERSVDIMSETKADSLTVVTKEHPLNIVKGLLPFIKSSRPFVIYHGHQEPLEETYVALKNQANVVNLRLFSNFLRSYQVLPERTHPEITTNDCGGYILTGYTGSAKNTC